MRLWWWLGSVVWLGTGCVVSRAHYDRQVAEARSWAETARRERARADALERQLQALSERLVDLEAARARLAAERVAVQVQVRGLREGLLLSEEKRRLLEEHVAQLAARERQLEALHSELSNVWFDAALSRARRRSQRPAPAPVQGATPVSTDTR
jgi:chromosome segregation ATPase